MGLFLAIRGELGMALVYIPMKKTPISHAGEVNVTHREIDESEMDSFLTVFSHSKDVF